MNRKKLRILILSCNTGEGHNTAARAIAEACRAAGHDAEIMDFLRLGTKHFSAFISNFYICLAKYFPYVFGFFYHVMLLISRTFSIGHSIVYWLNAMLAPRLGELLKRNRYDAVVATHMFAADAIARLKSKGMDVPLSLMVTTDYSCYPFLEEAACDYYVLAHEALVPVYLERGIPREKLCPFGIPISRRFVERPSKEEARARLGISPDERCYLVMGGSMGAGRMRCFSKRLSKAVTDGKIFVVCGKNRKLRKSLERRLEERTNVQVIGFTKEIPTYMAACDVLYTKPGGLTSTEALVSHTPTVHTKPIPGCETDNMRFFHAHGASIPAKRMKRQIRVGRMLANEPAQRERMRRAQVKLAKPHAAEQLLRLIEENTKEE